MGISCVFFKECQQVPWSIDISVHLKGEVLRVSLCLNLPFLVQDGPLVVVNGFIIPIYIYMYI